MPSEVEYAEAGIFYARWTDPITWDDIDGQISYIQGYAEDHQLERLVVIIDLSACSRPPMEIPKLQRRTAADRRTIGFIVVKMRPVIEVSMRILGNFARQALRTADTPEEALTLARELRQMDDEAEP